MKKVFSRVGILFFIVVFSIFPLALLADNAKVYKLHTVHYNAFPTDSLPPEMTERYHFKRSKNMALVNISILNNVSGLQFQGIKSKVTGVLKNLMAQEKILSFQEIHEGQAYYYIAEVPIDHNEMVKFIIHIKTSDNQDYKLTFNKQFGIM